MKRCQQATDWNRFGTGFPAGRREVGSWRHFWPVEDRTTALLMERFHRRLARWALAVLALAESQREMLRHPETAAPFFWAAFVITD
jgi:CHAT domain-containing protein